MSLEARDQEVDDTHHDDPSAGIACVCGPGTLPQAVGYSLGQQLSQVLVWISSQRRRLVHQDREQQLQLLAARPDVHDALPAKQARLRRDEARVLEAHDGPLLPVGFSSSLRQPLPPLPCQSQLGWPRLLHGRAANCDRCAPQAVGRGRAAAGETTTARATTTAGETAAFSPASTSNGKSRGPEQVQERLAPRRTILLPLRGWVHLRGQGHVSLPAALSVNARA